MLVANHFVQTYSWVNRAEVKVESLNWKRVGGDHVHAFIAEPTFTRWAKVILWLLCKIYHNFGKIALEEFHCYVIEED